MSALSNCNINIGHASMAVVTSVVYGFCLCATVSAVVTLTPSGNVPICANGANISLTCVTTAGPLLWEVETGNQLFNAPHGPTSEGRFDLVVNSVEQLVVNNITVLSINSTATLSDFQRDADDGIFIRCRETTSGDEKEAVFKSARLLNVTFSRLNKAVNIAWNPAVCFQYVVTIINSSDNSVYLNITTSDTNTTVTLPTGMEFCVTVLGVDSINRTGPASEPQCYTMTVPSSPTLTVDSGSVTTSTSPTVSPVLVGGVNAAAVAVPIVLILLLVVIATVVGVVLLVYCRRRERVNFMKMMQPPGNIEMNPIPKRKEYVCQVFCHDGGMINNWKFVFAFYEKIHLDAVKQFYKDAKFTEYASANSFKLEFDDIKVMIPDTTGWIVEQHGEVTKAAVEQYNGVGEPPYCQMTVCNASPTITPPDFHIVATINSAQKNTTIKLNKEALSVVECVCQVFYHREGINRWKATLAFFPKEQFTSVNSLYQDSNNSLPAIDVISGNTSVIKLSISNVPTEWKLSDFTKRQVKRADIEAYTGGGKPPYCEMTLRAADGSTPPDLTLPVTLTGVRQPTTITLERVAETTDGVVRPPLNKSPNSTKLVCRVFYHEVSTNCWKATFAFYPEDKAKRVCEIYQDANIHPTIVDLHFEWTTISMSSLRLRPKEENDTMWTCSGQLRAVKVDKSDIMSYTGGDKPPTLVVTFTAAPGQDNLPNLKRTIELYGIKPQNKFTIERMAIAHSVDTTSAPQFLNELQRKDDKTQKDALLLEKRRYRETYDSMGPLTPQNDPDPTPCTFPMAPGPESVSSDGCDRNIYCVYYPSTQY